MPTQGTAKWPKPKSEDEFEDILAGHREALAHHSYSHRAAAILDQN